MSSGRAQVDRTGRSTEGEWSFELIVTSSEFGNPLGVGLGRTRVNTMLFQRVYIRASRRCPSVSISGMSVSNLNTSRAN